LTELLVTFDLHVVYFLGNHVVP